MNTLYYAPGACSLSVHIVLEWLGEPYEAIKSNPADPDYLLVNKAGQVPSLKTESGEILTQCSAVLAYLAHTHPEAKLAGHPDALDQAELGRWSAFFTGDLHPAFFPIFMPGRYTTAEDQPSLDAVKAAGVALVRKRLALFEEHMTGRSNIVGTARSYVDAYSVPMIRWAAAMLPGGLDDFPAVRAHHEAMLADPGVKRALIAEGLIDG